MHYNTLMQDAEPTSPPLCGQWEQLWVDPMRQADSATPSSIPEIGIQDFPLSPSSPPMLADLGGASSAPDPHIPPDFSSMPLQLYNIATLEAEVKSLYEGLSGNAAALEILTTIRSGIHNSDWIDESYADGLVVGHNGVLYCPSPTCQRSLEGWDRLDRARDHIWADHLGRHYMCLWDGCSRTFKQQQECSKHISKLHQGNGKKFFCPTCAKALTTVNNLNRHMKDIHGLLPQTRIRRVVNRLRN